MKTTHFWASSLRSLRAFCVNPVTAVAIASKKLARPKLAWIGTIVERNFCVAFSQHNKMRKLRSIKWGRKEKENKWKKCLFVIFDFVTSQGNEDTWRWNNTNLCSVLVSFRHVFGKISTLLNDSVYSLDVLFYFVPLFVYLKNPMRNWNANNPDVARPNQEWSE